MNDSTRHPSDAFLLRSRAGTRSQRHSVRHSRLPGCVVSSSTRLMRVRSLCPPQSSGKMKIVATLCTEHNNACWANHACCYVCWLTGTLHNQSGPGTQAVKPETLRSGPHELLSIRFVVPNT